MGAHVSVPMYRRTLPQRLRLEAAECAECSAISFPPRAVCRKCGFGDLGTVTLKGTGAIEALTYLEAAGAPPEFADQVAVAGGYHVAIVRLDEGPMITAQLLPDSDVGAAPPAIGDRVAATTRVLYSEDGVTRYGFKFTSIHDSTE